VERVSAAGAQIERAEIPAARKPQYAPVSTLALPRPSVLLLRAGVARRDAAAPIAEARIEAGDDACKVAPHGCGVASLLNLPKREALRQNVKSRLAAGALMSVGLRVSERVQSLVREGGLRSPIASEAMLASPP